MSLVCVTFWYHKDLRPKMSPLCHQISSSDIINTNPHLTWAPSNSFFDGCCYISNCVTEHHSVSFQLPALMASEMTSDPGSSRHKQIQNHKFHIFLLVLTNFAPFLKYRALSILVVAQKSLKWSAVSADQVNCFCMKLIPFLDWKLS